MIIVTNWPNLLANAGHVANMKRYHSSNAMISTYAEKLGFFRWIVRIPGQGLNSKERGDIFESFIGALVLIGEFYIGDQMGLAIARLFLNQFFKTVEWHPEDTEFYEAPKSLWNDWKMSLPQGQRVVKDVLKPRQIDDIWHLRLTIEDSAKEGGPIFQKTGKNMFQFYARNRSEQDAQTDVYLQLREKLNLKRSDISKQRRMKQESNPDIEKYVKQLEDIAGDRKLRITGKTQRGNRIFVSIEETVTAYVGERQLVYDMTIATAWEKNTGNGRNAEIEATKKVVQKFINGDVYKPIPGADLDFSNPDEDVIPSTKFTDTSKTQIKDSKVEKGRGNSTNGRGRGRGNSTNGRGRGRGKSTNDRGDSSNKTTVKISDFASDSFW